MSYPVSASQLRKAAAIAQKIENLQAQLNQILGAAPSAPSDANSPRPKRRLSPSARARIAAAQKARWAREKQKEK